MGAAAVAAGVDGADEAATDGLARVLVVGTVGCVGTTDGALIGLGLRAIPWLERSQGPRTLLNGDG